MNSGSHWRTVDVISFEHVSDRSGMDAVVFHVDADAFFAACHLAVNPELAGIPLVVGGDPATRHGIVLTATYEARAFGVKTAMPLAQALRLCPHLTVLSPEGKLYEAFSRRLRRLFDDFTPVVEPASIDEAWLDMGGGVLRRFGHDPVAGARELQRRAQEEIGLSVSVGIARNKMLAKQASDLEKPHGLTTLWPDEVPFKLWPKPVQVLYGVGPRLNDRFQQDGIVTVGDLARVSETRLRQLYGASGQVLSRRARGVDETAVAAPVAGQEQSLSVERTLARDVVSTADADRHLRALAHELAGRLRSHDQAGSTVVLKYKTAAFVLHTRQRTLARVTRSEEVLYATARDLFATRPHADPVRLLGLGITQLAPEQGDLFDDPRERALADTVDSIRSRFGSSAIGPARVPLRRPQAPSTFRRAPDHPDE
ncbi:MAG: DNA polymerase IV [Clostridia bacterium]